MRRKLSRAFLVLFALSLPIAILGSSPLKAQNFPGVLTWHNDVGRTGQNLNETRLTPANVKVDKFGKIFSFPVDGNIFAQPLYVPGVNVFNQGVHNVLYVVTENDSVYAFDADGGSAAPLWKVSFLHPPDVVAQPCATGNVGCVITPILGITGTPVIDPDTGTLYLVANTQEGSVVVQRLHALDITSGAEKFGGPVVVQANFPGTGAGSTNGVVQFAADHHLQRSALLLLNGRLYIAWRGTHGWLMSYDAHNLSQKAVFNSSPNSSASGIWMSGAGPAADPLGNIYVATANGPYDADTGGPDFGDSLLKFDANLAMIDSFTPMDQACRQAHDRDLASGGPVILPPQPGPNPDEMLIIGKGGNPCDRVGSKYASPFYVVNFDHLGGYDPTQDQNIQTVAGPTTFVLGSPAYWQSSTGSYVYLSGYPSGGGGDFLRQYSLINGLLSPTPVFTTKDRYVVGTTPSISANGQTNGVLWTIKRQEPLNMNPGTLPAILLAYDASNVSKLLYSSAQAGSRDQAGPATKFLPPTIANGHVYVGTQTEVDVYGPLPTFVSPSSLAFVTRGVGVTSPAKAVTFTNSQTKSLLITNISASGDFAQTNTCGGSVAAGSSCTINVTFTPTNSGTRTGTLTITDNATPNIQTVALSGIGTFVKLSGTTLPFGTVPVTQSLTKKMTVKNVGTTAVALTSISIGGTNAGDFSQTNTCGTSIAAGASCSISVKFSPTATGSRTAVLTLTDDDASGSQTVALSGTGS